MTTIKKGIPSRGWTLWFLWILASTVGSVIGLAVSLAAAQAVGEIVSSIALGAIVGLAQWLVVRRHLRDPGWWILATASAVPAGVAVANTVHMTRPYSGSPSFLGTLGLVAFGFVVGIAQWLVLRRHLSRTGLWVLATTVSWFVGALIARFGGALVAMTIGLGRISDFFQLASYFVTIGVITGAGTGVVLVLLVRRPVPSCTRRVNPFGGLAIAGFALALVAVQGACEHIDYGSGVPRTVPDPGPGSTCSELPPIACVGSHAHCGELVLFEPVRGVGYVNYPVNGETWDNQYRSYLTRDLTMLIKYASARVACESGGWDYGRVEPLGLADMSEADGSMPGTSTGRPGHPPGTHENGRDIDLAYFQGDDRGVNLSLKRRQPQVEGNLLKVMCKHTMFGAEVYHCTEPAHLLDPWRTSLFVAYLSEHTRLRVIVVDAQIGPVLDATLDRLVEAGWIDADLRQQIPLHYEAADQGRGWFRHHHHHMHVGMEG